MSRVVLFCFLVCLAGDCLAADVLGRFVTGTSNPESGITLVQSKKSPYIFRTLDSVPVVAPGKNPEYLLRKAVRLRVDLKVPPTDTVTVVLEHMDDNIGLIEVHYDNGQPISGKSAESNPVYAAAQALAGYTCTGTGKRRHAVFVLSKPSFQHRQEDGADISIEGVSSLYSVTLIAGKNDEAIAQARREIPTSVPPRFTLKRPMDFVTTAGAHKGTKEDLPATFDAMHELCPVVQTLGFTGIESYVTWNNVEPEKGRFDWSYYDGVALEARKYGLKWFPLLIVGSSYSLPKWFHDSSENVGFQCLEHHKGNNIQSIFCENQTPYVKNFLTAFGTHYEPMDVLLGVRLGPSGNFGESQYPAGGNWGYAGELEHIHVGWWAGDPNATLRFREYLKKKYATIEALNNAWSEKYASFDAVETFIPQFAETQRKRKDFVDWYMDAMTAWCERWDVWAREAMPKTPIYQSSGGWGFVESGTDFTDQTKSMTKMNGGIRATNETDSYAQNFYATRMLSSSARFYGVPFGTEPAGFNSARGVVARIYNILVNNGQHLFYYDGNLLANDQATTKWLELAPLLDQRDEPFIEVAALYPDTKSKLDDGLFRNLYSFSFNERVAALRPQLDFDFCSERMILDGALDRYKVLLFLWSDVLEPEVLQKIDGWVRAGGKVIYPYWGRMPLTTPEGDYSVYNRWLTGDCGKGKVVFDRGDRAPAHRYTDFIADQLRTMKDLDPLTQHMLRAKKPDEVYVSVLKNGTFAILNYTDKPARVMIPGTGSEKVASYSIKLITGTRRSP